MVCSRQLPWACSCLPGGLNPVKTAFKFLDIDIRIMLVCHPDTSQPKNPNPCDGSGKRSVRGADPGFRKERF